MKKKILLILSALLIFYMPLSKEHQQVEAVAVVSKVVNASAKKVAKEAIKDTAVQMSMEFAMNYKYVPKDQRTPKPGFEMVCLPKNKKSDGECSAPMEIKKLSSADKVTLGNKVEEVLDKKVAGGIGATRWGKFLNWFLPIFTIGMGVAVLDYAMNGEVSDLFDDIAMDALKALGFISPSVATAPPVDLPDNEYTPIEGQPSPDAMPELLTNLPEGWKILNESTKFYYGNHDITVILEPVDQLKEYYYIQPFRGTTERAVRIYFKAHGATVVGKTILWTKLEVGIWQKGNVYDPLVRDKPISWATGMASPSQNQIPLQNSQLIDLFNNYQELPIVREKGYVAPPEVEPIPEYDQLQLPRTIKEGTPVKVPAPGSIPFTKTDTGEQLLPYPKPDGSTGWKTKIGTEVPEDSVTVGNPLITEKPDGSKIVTKQPTVDTPVPSPTDDGIIPPPTTPKPPDGTEFPPGPSCSAQLQLPRLLPLFTQISETFPFSIPWDLKSGFDAIFLKMGSEKPEFEYKLAFQGQEHDFSFKIPSFFDNWMPFIHSILLLTFDIGIVYAIYRFMKGGSG